MTSHHDVAARLRDLGSLIARRQLTQRTSASAFLAKCADLLETQATALSEAEREATSYHGFWIEERDKRIAAEARLAEIGRIVHVPTPSGEKADHHFQRDFDAIRNLTAPFRAFTNAAKEKT